MVSGATSKTASVFWACIKSWLQELQHQYFYFWFNQNWARINANGPHVFSNNEPKVSVCKDNMWSKFQNIR